MTPSSIHLAAEGCEAEISLVGAEPLAWRMEGRELLWSGDPAYWGFRAPILFPTVGASKDAEVLVDGRVYPMAQHGFARRLPFELVGKDGRSARLRLVENAETLSHFPFWFSLEVEASVAAGTLTLAFTVTNTGEAPMPYGLGFHPAFLWPFVGAGQDRHHVLFEHAESHDIPAVGPGGLLTRATRHVPLDGRTLALTPDLFSEALVFLKARSRRMSFVAPSGEAITLAVENFPHLAVWTKPNAPFLSLEAWSAHAEWEDETGELAARDSMTILKPGESAHHRATATFGPAP